MARTPFGSGKGQTDSQPVFTPPAASSAPSSSSSSSPGGLTAFIDQGSEFEGKLSFKDTVRIDGRFSGEISSENTLIVGESGEIHANIQSKVVAVSGVVTGNIVATSKVVVHKTGRVEGDVETSTLVIEEGAVINGGIRMGKAPLKAVEGKPVDSKPVENKSAAGEPKKN